ncbi:MAG: RNA-binding protein [Deltaproteobacteria bacterium]|nr:MAG: RNA-binding protein [Deltaproteobacteria bacterium]
MDVTLLIGNLSKEVCSEDLTEIFTSIGEVVVAATERDWGETRRQGYVTMRDADAAVRAAQVLDGHALYGQPMVVRRAQGLLGADADHAPRWLQ